MSKETAWEEFWPRKSMIDSIKIIKIESFDIGFERLKKAKLENSKNYSVYEYKKAIFSLEDVIYQDVSPSTFYALREKIEFQRNLLKILKSDLSLDIFNLPGIIYLEVNGEIRGLCPPIIEEYVEEDGKIAKVLQDGVHRFLLAKKLGRRHMCILIKNLHANKKYLPYAYPNSWKMVKVSDKVPSVKKKYRRNDKYSFMRPLNAIFDETMNVHWKDYAR